MSKVPALHARQILRALEKAGFRIVRQRGSHVRLIHASDPTRYATVPMHGGDVPRKNVASILRQAKLSVDEFLQLLD
ncbi:addiction module toxin, HicA family [Candidatus Parcubacteria bacterium]|nr:MAG: addiction module toxin, HicA family [Candidatus Parcubacteria bacterium]